MITNTWLNWFLILSLTLSSFDARIVNENHKRMGRAVRKIPRQIEKDRSKREFNPQTSPLNTIRTALQWRPNNQQPQGQVFK